MKKLIVILLAVIMVFALMACTPVQKEESKESAEKETAQESVDDSAQESEEVTSDVPTPPSKKVAWIASHMQNEFVLDFAANAEKAGEEAGWEVTTFDPNLDLNLQISQIENAAAQGYAAVCFDPISYDGMTAVVESVREQYPDVAIIAMHGSCSCEDLLTAFVSVDLIQGGEIKMQKCADDLGGKGDIAIMTGTEGQSTMLAVNEGYDNILEKYPDINIVFKGAGDWNPDDATPLAENWLSSGKHLDAIVCDNDGMALGVRAVLKNSGMSGKIKLYGLDATREARAAVRAGEMDASVWINSYAEWVEAFKIINAYYSGEPFENKVLVQTEIVTKDNIDTLFPND